ncbi:MAG TPA: surface carbohydrate biosynthesis protein [Vicinamibacterales bacterium]
MTNPRVVLAVNHPDRDLAGLVLTALELCRRGVTCYLAPANMLEREVWALRPDLVLLHFARRGIDGFARQLAEAGIASAVLDTEGGVWESCDAYTELLWPDRALLAHVRPFCAWGPKLASHLTREGLFRADQIAITGCPRFDFYHPDWRHVLAPADGDAAPRILINTNFSMSNPRFVSPETNVANLRDVYGWDAARVEALLDAERRAIDAVIAMAGDLAREFPHAQIVLRPHPFENPGRYGELLALPNAEVNGRGPVQAQIARARVVIQRSCTTAIESGFAGVPTLSPQWFEAPFLMPMAEEVSLPCDDYPMLRDAVAAALSGTFVLPPPQRAAIGQVTGDWFHTIDGRSHLRVSEAVEAGLPRERRVDERLCERLLYGLDGTRRPAAETVGRTIRHRLHLGPDWSFRRMRQVPSRWWDQSDKAFTASDVAAVIGRIRRHDGKGPDMPCTIDLARDAGECLHGTFGRAVRIRAREA